MALYLSLPTQSLVFAHVGKGKVLELGLDPASTFCSLGNPGQITQLLLASVSLFQEWMQ